jgi:hypothetical protein
VPAIDAAASLDNQKLEVPPDLARRIRRHFRNFFAQKSSLDESQILHDLSTSLRGELSEYLVERGAMSEVTIFRNSKTLTPSFWFCRNFAAILYFSKTFIYFSLLIDQWHTKHDRARLPLCKWTRCTGPKCSPS